MTTRQIVVNATAVRNLAERLEAWGLDDAHHRAEYVALNLLADGYRPLEREPERAGPSSTETARRAALDAAAAAVRAAKDRRTGTVTA